MSDQEKFRCPRREENPNSGTMFPGWDEWRDLGLHCSYCGSTNPARFLELVKAGREIGPTDKNYKAYVDTSSLAEGRTSDKFYFQHFSKLEQEEFLSLYKARKILLSTPGFFYVLPFFITTHHHHP